MKTLADFHDFHKLWKLATQPEDLGSAPRMLVNVGAGRKLKAERDTSGASAGSEFWCFW